MGVDQGVLWARVPELVGIRLADGEIVADSARIEARNPPVAGLLPKPADTAIFLPQEMQPLKFVADVGLVILLADARRVRIDPLTLAALPYQAPAADRSEATTADPAREPEPRRVPIHTLGNGMDWRALVRTLPRVNFRPTRTCRATTRVFRAWANGSSSPASRRAAAWTTNGNDDEPLEPIPRKPATVLRQGQAS